MIETSGTVGAAPRTLLRSVRVVDLDGARTGAGSSAPVDVRIADGRVVETAPSLAARGDEDVVDLDGRWVLPGLWDAHTHMSQWALTRRRLDVSTATSAETAAGMVVERLAADPLPDGGVLVAAGFRDGLWPDAPTAAVLDRAIAAAGLPPAAVVVVSADLHCAWLSTPALVRFEAPDHPTGLLRETEWMRSMNIVDQAPAEQVDAWVGDAAREAAGRGVVGVVDLEIDDNLTAWRRRTARGVTMLRVAAGVWPEHLDRALPEGLATGDVVPGTSGLVTMGPLKVIVDGSLNTRTACCRDPYPGLEGTSGAHGMLTVPPEELVGFMRRAHGHGLACAIHAIGDRATGVVLDAFAATGARGSIEHAQLVTDDDVARMADLGVVASVQPEHAMDDRDVADHHWAGRTGRAFAYGTLARAGVTMTFGSDAPVAALDPWAAIDAAVHRARDGREPWHPEQRLPVRAALAASVRSRVAVGQVADLAVLDADPYADDGAALRGTTVAATVLAGRWTHRAL